MKESALGTKLLMLAVTVCVLSYFAVQGLEYLSDPLTTTLAYEYQVEETVDLTGYVVRRETVLPDEASGLLQLQRASGSAPGAQWHWCMRTRRRWTGKRRSRS